MEDRLRSGKGRGQERGRWEEDGKRREGERKGRSVTPLPANTLLGAIGCGRNRNRFPTSAFGLTADSLPNPAVARPPLKTAFLAPPFVAESAVGAMNPVEMSVYAPGLQVAGAALRTSGGIEPSFVGFEHDGIDRQ